MTKTKKTRRYELEKKSREYLPWAAHRKDLRGYFRKYVKQADKLLTNHPDLVELGWETVVRYLLFTDMGHEQFERDAIEAGRKRFHEKHPDAKPLTDKEREVVRHLIFDRVSQAEFERGLIELGWQQPSSLDEFVGI